MALLKKGVKKAVFLLLVATFFSSCLYKGQLVDKGGNDFESLVAQLVLEISKKLKQNIQIDDIVLVSDYVNLKNLKNKSQLGFLLSDLTKDKLLAMNILVREIEFRKNFTLGEDGLASLSRNRDKILNKTLHSTRYAVVGTYTISNSSLNLFLKLIDTQTGVILASSFERTSVDEEILELESARTIRPHLVL